MAVAFSTVSAVKRGNATTTIAIDKPTGLAAGDLMVAHVVRSDNDQTSRTWTPPASWTQIIDTQGNDSGSGSSGMASFWKVADSGDAAASNFTFTISTTADFLAGAIYRITGHHGTTPVSTSASSFVNNDETPSHANTITPHANCLLLMLVHHREGGGTGKTTSAYAITTSNPSWTEAYDDDSTASSLTIAGAYASRPEATATGNSSFTGSGDATTDSGSMVVAIRPPIDVTVSPDTVTGSGTVNTPTIAGGGTVTPSTVTGTSTVNTPTEMGQADWSAQSKSTAPTWTALSKS